VLAGHEVLMEVNNAGALIVGYSQWFLGLTQNTFLTIIFKLASF
jgi:hypothetical protein